LPSTDFLQECVITKDSKANQSLNYYEDIINQGINENESAIVISTEWEKQAEKLTMYLIS
jgi:hypothetical protein